MHPLSSLIMHVSIKNCIPLYILKDLQLHDVMNEPCTHCTSSHLVSFHPHLVAHAEHHQVVEGGENGRGTPFPSYIQ